LHTRIAIIKILGELKEPMARELLLSMTSDLNPRIRNAATEALASFELQKPEVFAYAVRWKWEVIVAAFLVLMMVFALWTSVKLLFDRINLRIGLLSAIPVMLLGWITCLAVLDLSAGFAHQGAIDAAIRNRDMVALKTMNYHHMTFYPGDSYVAQYLVRTGIGDAVHCLLLLPTAVPDDGRAYMKILSHQSRWAIARIIGTRLGTRELDEMTASGIPEVRAAIAEYLGRLKVKNQEIIETLTHLTNDGDEVVRTKAVEALAKAQGSPLW
jgi:hypothetical protein